jgi:UDP-glucose 4-epimerase
MLQKGNPLKVLDHKVVVITGGTGSLGKVLTRRLLTGEMGVPEKIIVFSRDEAKQHAMRMEYEQRVRMNHPEIYQAFKHLVDFRIGDIRDYHAVCAVLKYGDVVVNAAALKQVPICEYFPYEAVQTNIIGPENIIRAIRENKLPIQRVI